MSETASPTIQALIPQSEKGMVAQAIKERTPDSLFAYGGEVIARPSATGRYVVSDLEMGVQGIDLAYDFDPLGTRRREIQLRFDKERGEVIASVIVPNEVADQALFQAQLANNTWDLRALLDVIREAVKEATSAAGQAAREALEVLPKAAIESAQISGHLIADVVKQAPGLATGPALIPKIEAAPAPPQIETSPTPAELEPLADDASVAEVTTRLSELTGLADRELGQLFFERDRTPVTREHYWRWRTGAKPNARPGNRRRMWFLLRLFEDLARGDVAVQEWLRNPTTIDEKTPYDLLRVGRFDEVEHLTAGMIPAPAPVEIISAEGRPVLVEQAPAVFTPRTAEPSDDLAYEEDAGWIEIEQDIDDDETDDE